MTTNNLKNGDCVQLKHGGGNIKMTIDILFTYHGRQRANCKYFNEKENKFEELAVDVDALKSCDSTQS